jgi:hypothetical protein
VAGGVPVIGGALLKPGRYTMVSYLRFCHEVCNPDSPFGPKRYRCQARFRIRVGRAVKAIIHVARKQPCTIRIRHLQKPGVPRKPHYCPERTGIHPPGEAPPRGFAFNANKLRHHPVSEARRIAHRHRCVIRVLGPANTAEHQSNRINVIAKHRRIRRVVGVG